MEESILNIFLNTKTEAIRSEILEIVKAKVRVRGNIKIMEALSIRILE